MILISNSINIYVTMKLSCGGNFTSALLLNYEANGTNRCSADLEATNFNSFMITERASPASSHGNLVPFLMHSMLIIKCVCCTGKDIYVNVHVSASAGSLQCTQFYSETCCKHILKCP
jgi:hypothetical protein